MHNVTFFPLGNADSCLVELSGGESLLFDYANTRSSDDPADKRIDLPAEIKRRLTSRKKDCLDVVAFTHADADHVAGASDFFFLEHAAKYQAKGRVPIKELWVPAALILENGLEEEAQILQAEAKHRLRAGTGIRVFSRPDRLKDWLNKQGIKLEDRAHLITDAGQIVPGFSKEIQSLEVFVHSPFAKHCDGQLIDRNESSLILHLTFSSVTTESRIFLIGDTTCDVLQDIVNITLAKNRDERLAWDIYDIPHHCSYLSLAPEKGEDATKPVQQVETLLAKGAEGCILVSCSEPIPSEDTDQPPHRQAADCYKQVAEEKSGQFLVTMEFPPKAETPEALVIEFGDRGTQVIKRTAAPISIVSQRSAPRAG